jgi:hypothetical protein
MSLPNFLLIEVRAAFRHSARQHAAFRRCPYSTTAFLYARTPSKKSFPIPVPRNNHPPKQNSEPFPSVESSRSSDDGTTDLVQPRQPGELDTGRHVEVPTRVLPPAALGPNVKLSPMQRLHIEHMTRHPPPKKPSKPFKERLLIYHAGYLTVTALVFTRVLSICVAAFCTFIWVPSYYAHGTPLVVILPMWAASFLPIGLVHILTRSFVTEAFLRLPTHARANAQAAMNYARSMARDATLQLRFYRWTGLPGTTDVKIVDTMPIASTWRPVNFKVTGAFVDRGMWLKRNPTEFFLHARTASKGKAARETVPGLWEVVYKRLTGRAASEVPKWKT